MRPGFLFFSLVRYDESRRKISMSKNQKQTVRKPAMKFPNLRKKIQKQKVQQQPLHKIGKKK
jgi:hypothetical protein